MSAHSTAWKVSALIREARRDLFGDAPAWFVRAYEEGTVRALTDGGLILFSTDPKGVECCPDDWLMEIDGTVCVAKAQRVMDEVAQVEVGSVAQALRDLRATSSGRERVAMEAAVRVFDTLMESL